ncbi:MAG: hypothetical protein JNJ60_08095 [Rhodocyclaceae bacterium]|nr:hypothetical protein [Rhodocyclaceae bacterium]
MFSKTGFSSRIFTDAQSRVVRRTDALDRTTVHGYDERGDRTSSQLESVLDLPCSERRG